MIDKVTVGIIQKVLTVASNQLLTFDVVFSQTLSIICLNSSLSLAHNGLRHSVIGCKICAVFFIIPHFFIPKFLMKSKVARVMTEATERRANNRDTVTTRSVKL